MAVHAPRRLIWLVGTAYEQRGRSGYKHQPLVAFATIFSYICFVSKKEKLIERFLSMPSDFHYGEMVRLLGYFEFTEVKTGKTSGSRAKFVNEAGLSVYMHKPHPSGIMKRYQLKQVKEILGL